MSETSVRLRKAMQARHLTHKDLAEAVGCSTVAIHKILSGNTKRSRLLPSIAKALNVKIEWLLGASLPPDKAPGRSPVNLPGERVLCGIFERLLLKYLQEKTPVGCAAFLASHFPQALAEVDTAAPKILGGGRSGLERSSGSKDISSDLDVAARLASALKEKEISQNKLARAAGCSQVTISRILSRRIIASRWLPDIARALEIDPAWLIEGDNDLAMGDSVFR